MREPGRNTGCKRRCLECGYRINSGNSSVPIGGSADLCLLDRLTKNLTPAAASKNPATHQPGRLRSGCSDLWGAGQIAHFVEDLDPILATVAGVGDLSFPIATRCGWQ